MNCVGRSSNLEEDSELLEAGNGGESEAGHLLAEQHPLVTPFQQELSFRSGRGWNSGEWWNLPELLIVGIFRIESTSSAKSQDVQWLEKVEQLQLDLLRQVRQGHHLLLLLLLPRIKSNVQLHYC